jgi:cytidylate kinase
MVKMTQEKQDRHLDQEQLLIAIDGPSGAGKSTISKMLATRLQINYLDTGAMYRAVAYIRLNRGLPENEPEQLAELLAQSELRIEHTPQETKVFLNSKDITMHLRTPDISQEASRISTWSPIRKYLVQLQRTLCSQGNYVVEGRDIGTVVLPETPYKFYLDAGLSARASRRQLQLVEQGISKDVMTVTQEISKRDSRDQTRADSPLKLAKDAILIDSTDLTREEVVQKIIREIDLIRQKIERKKEIND